MIKVHVTPGICGFETEITAESSDGQNAAVTITTACPNLKPLADALREVDGFAACFGTICESSVYQVASQYCSHAACPVPCAIVKGIEAACGFALPKDVEIKIEKE